MTNTFRIAILFFIGLCITSCSKDEKDKKDDIIDKFDENINVERFKNLEIGNSKFKIPQIGDDIHINFDYQGTSKVQKIWLDVKPIRTEAVNNNNFVWKLTKHLVPTKYYLGQLNPKIHYHASFNKPSNNPSAKPAKGTYKVKITIEHKDGSKSAITKKVEIIQKFQNFKVTVAPDYSYAQIKFRYLSNTIEKITCSLTIEKGADRLRVREVPTNLFAGVNNPVIDYRFDLFTNLPKGKYEIYIHVKETGQKEKHRNFITFTKR